MKDLLVVLSLLCSITLSSQKFSLEFTSELVHNIAESDFDEPAARMKFFEGASTHHTRTNFGVGFNYHFTELHSVKLRFMQNEIATTIDRFLQYGFGPNGIGIDTSFDYMVKESYVSHSLSYIFSLQRNNFCFPIEMGVIWNRLSSSKSFYHPKHTFGEFISLGIEYRINNIYSFLLASRYTQIRSTLLYGSDYVPTDVSAELSFRYRIYTD